MWSAQTLRRDLTVRGDVHSVGHGFRVKGFLLGFRV